MGSGTEPRSLHEPAAGEWIGLNEYDATFMSFNEMRQAAHDAFAAGCLRLGWQIVSDALEEMHKRGVATGREYAARGI